ncbi:hypothetical protein MF672_039125 [Actinomadura sp. ATCC 31491]|uniref:Uncharacterized protein n=1 Tax=Actinomadura luzonensis TaxID=2805427 RepID=A0ABT0G5W9_9ACTN|nr:hypothetical protein [Actinomadura luzonensis]MCK2219768.1 hypothetical protein [Actinomadura luzonensis]
MPGETITESLEDYRRRLAEMQRMAAIQWLDLGEVLKVDTGGGTFVTLSVPAEWSDRRRARFIRMAQQLARDLDEED